MLKQQFIAKRVLFLADWFRKPSREAIAKGLRSVWKGFGKHLHRVWEAFDTLCKPFDRRWQMLWKVFEMLSKHLWGGCEGFAKRFKRVCEAFETLSNSVCEAFQMPKKCYWHFVKCPKDVWIGLKFLDKSLHKLCTFANIWSFCPPALPHHTQENLDIDQLFQHCFGRHFVKCPKNVWPVSKILVSFIFNKRKWLN